MIGSSAELLTRNSLLLRNISTYHGRKKTICDRAVEPLFGVSFGTFFASSSATGCKTRQLIFWLSRNADRCFSAKTLASNVRRQCTPFRPSPAV